MLTHADIQRLLTNLSAAIELDQRRVDEMPKDDFHPMYDDGLWRAWRTDHVRFIDALMPSVASIRAPTLRALNQIAVNYDPHVVRHAVLESFAGAVGGGYPVEEVDTAERFLRVIIGEVRVNPPGRLRRGGAKEAAKKWVSAEDPLRISEDPECQYKVSRHD
ncbi:hypothetical protein XH94_10850 [Bradyrhizobium zhanjiangense]|uniref:Uncharacterized protein n=1 Tax=Bradyrhizobium zhanjiangense TaxID=1325107 RepID=A0A4Q0SMC7_9BRAD|nr:hypothetical protein XH94_10850 [Bradyrhizobium zhanjiangense]